jgi:2-hydroxychromene-2-carboxylate isomerase
MSRHIDFYFDFISPFGYLANVKLPALAEKWGCRIEYKPVDIMAAKLAAGNYGPSTRAIPAKARYIRQDRLRWAKRYGVPMNDPKAFSAPRLNSGVFYAARKGQAQAYMDASYHQVWGVGVDPDDDAVLGSVAQGLGWNADDFFAYVNSDAARQEYADSKSEAKLRGVFGVPMMVLGEQMFWGNDRLDFLEECLASAR